MPAPSVRVPAQVPVAVPIGPWAMWTRFADISTVPGEKSAEQTVLLPVLAAALYPKSITVHGLTPSAFRILSEGELKLELKLMVALPFCPPNRMVSPFRKFTLPNVKMEAVPPLAFEPES